MMSEMRIPRECRELRRHVRQSPDSSQLTLCDLGSGIVAPATRTPDYLLCEAVSSRR
jgi:hypothetical protein